MFSQKSLRFTIAFVLLIGLAAMGIAYGAWTDRLTIGGTVHTGTLSVRFDNYENGELYTNCFYNFAEDGKSVSVTYNNAAPGDECPLPLDIVNDGSINVKLSEPVQTSGPTGWVTMKELSGADLSPYNYLMPGQHAYTSLSILVPDNAGQDGSVSFSFKIDASQ
jgi:hypothetical protein